MADEKLKENCSNGKLSSDEGISSTAISPTVQIEMEELDIASSGVTIEAVTSRLPSPTHLCHMRHLNSLTLLTSLASMAYTGILLRMGIVSYFAFAQPQSFLYNVTWANFLGCFLMGLLTDHKAALAKFYAPLAVALQTGFCGSLTSFSSVIVTGSSVTFGLPNCRSHAHERTLAFLENYFFNFIISFVVFLYGRQLSHSSCMERLAGKMLKTEDRSNHGLMFMPVVNVLFYMLVTFICLLFAIYIPESRTFTAAMLFGQLGAIVRYYVGKFFNPCCPLFPVGTFIANVLGSLLSAIATSSCIYLGDKVDSAFAMFLLAVSNGFCGALTTVSTFVAETALLPGLATSCRYSLLSLLFAQLLAFVPYSVLYFLLEDAKPLYC